MILTIKDETFTGEIINEVQIELDSEVITVKDLIISRVIREVDLYNRKSNEKYNGLVVPADEEKYLNGYKLKKKRTIDAEKQIYVALNAFKTNGFFMLINDVQAETLEQEVIIKPDSTVSFIKLTPLIGG